MDSNLHRENIFPSEKAFAYKLKYDALSHQGTSRQVGTKLRTDEIMTEIKANQRESVKISAERLHKVIPTNYSNKQAEEFVIKACEYYTRFLQKQREHEER